MEVLERGAQLELLGARLAEARRGRGSLVLVAGEAGVGKTTLATALRDRHPTAVTWWGACDAMRTARPLGPLHDIARAAGGPLADLVGRDAPRHQSFGALLDRLTVAGPPRLVVMEDVHSADEATLDLLQFLARRVAGTRSVVLATYRDDEVQAGHRLRAVLGDLATTTGVHRLAVAPLTRDTVAALADERGLDPVRLFDVTGGNPFFVTEVLDAPGHEVPPTVRDALLARTGRLSSTARAAADVASLVPNQVEVALLRAVGVADAGIDECQLAGVLQGDGPTIRFRHELARLAVAHDVPAARRSALHAAILDHLVATGADPARVAHHADEAGDAGAVLVFAPVAAQRASRMGAHREAAAHYARALRFAGGRPAADVAELSERLSRECASAGLLAEAVAASQSGITLWREAGDLDRAAALQGWRGHQLWTMGRSTEGYETARAAVAMLESQADGPGLAAALTHLAYLQMLARDIDGAIGTGERAMRIGERFDLGPLRSRALNAVGSAQWFRDPVAALDTLNASIDAARAADDDYAEAAAMCNLGSGAGEVRRYDIADPWLRRTLNWAIERDLDIYRVYSLAWIARSHFEQGQWDEAAVAATEALRLRNYHLPSGIVAVTVAARLRVRRGDADADGYLDEAWDLARRTGDLQRLWPAAAARAEAAWLRGAPMPAELESTYAMADALGHDWARGELGFWRWRHGQEVDPANFAEPYVLQVRGRAQEAAAAWRSLGCPYEEADALSGSDDRAELTTARAAFAALGAWPAAERVALRLRALGVPAVGRPRRSTLDNPARLTDREIEVLRLVAANLRNAEIAARLHITAKTVDHHVSNILGKLGVASRRDAGAAARSLLPDG